MANKAIVYRLKPTARQKEWLIQNIGSCRFVYNLALSWRIKAYAADGTCLSYADTAYGVARCKDVYPWLKEADSASLQQSLRHLQDAYTSFFTKKARFPVFKSRHRSRMAYTTPMNGNSIRVGERSVTLPKVGRIAAKIHRAAPKGWKIKSATVSMERDGKFYCSILYEYDAVIEPVSHPERNAVGIDYKSNGLGMLSDGTVIGSPKKTQQYAQKLARAQRRLSCKYGSRKGEAKSANWNKQNRNVNRIHRKIANSRLDHLHKKSLAIAKQYDLVCVEDLNMTEIAHLHGFRKYRKATYDNGYGIFLGLLEYKLADRGKVLLKIGKDFPSSRRCSACGHVLPGLEDNIRKWTCPACGIKHDRDLNAAVNIRNEGIRVFKEQTA